MALLESGSVRNLLLLYSSVAFVIYRLALYVTRVQRWNNIIREKGCKPYKNYPHKDPVLGLDLFVENLGLLNKGGWLDRVSDRYERLNTWTFSHLLFGERVIHTAEPENIKAILATQFNDFAQPARRKAAFRPTLGHGIFSTDGPEWETSRALLRPNFARSQAGDIDSMEEHVSNLINKFPRDGSVIDIQPLFFALTMDSATDLLFGQSAGTLIDGETSESGERFAEAYDYMVDIVGLHARLGKIVTMLPNKRYTDAIKFVHKYVGGYVQKAFEIGKTGYGTGKRTELQRDKYVFLDELAKSGVDKQKIQDELLNVLFAGRDTTAGLLAYTFHILARRPDVFEKLRAEVMSIGSTRPTFESIKNMTYLRYTLNEVLRLFPIVPANARAATRDTTLPVGGGPDGKSPIFVKRGQAVNYQVYTMHRRKDLYGEDALEFKPERWAHFRPPWQYLPFNGGPRICIGQQFALTQASYTVIRILQNFKSIKPDRDDGPPLELLTLTAAVRGGVHISLQPA